MPDHRIRAADLLALLPLNFPDAEPVEVVVVLRGGAKVVFPVVAEPQARTTDDLRRVKDAILKVLHPGETATGEELAKRTPYDCNSRFRRALSELVKEKILENSGRGYSRPNAD